MGLEEQSIIVSLSISILNTNADRPSMSRRCMMKPVIVLFVVLEIAV